VDCLGIVPVQVKKFKSETEKIKIPQMGWNTIYNLKTPLFEAINDQSFIYNVHSYYAEDSAYTIASCDYGVTYAAAVQKDNFYGVQFHTEKSAATGERIIKNFLDL
jgi:glutamine amidotransferase